MLGPSTLLQHKEEITAVTPSKPNIGHLRFVAACFIVQFTLVMVLVVLSVIVREAMI
jgi:hypothetical protein